ncbi:hypothetical protein EON62_04830 [archaeon]|nr:MAG: hypothetical protein EON62_04830 [archaeon]
MWLYSPRPPGCSCDTAAAFARATMSKRTFATAFPGARSAREEVEDESASELEDDMLEGDSDVEEMMAAGVLPGVTTTEAAAKMLPNNIAGLQQAFARLHDDVDWIHRLEIVSADSLVGADVNDDLKLEMALYVCTTRVCTPCCSILLPPTAASFATLCGMRVVTCVLPVRPACVPSPPSPPAVTARRWLPPWLHAPNWSAWACRTTALTTSLQK